MNMILFVLLLLSVVGVSLVAYAYMPVAGFFCSVVAMATTVVLKSVARLLARVFFIVKDFAVTVILTAKDAIIIVYDVLAFKIKAGVVIVAFIANIKKTFAEKKSKSFCRSDF